MQLFGTLWLQQVKYIWPSCVRSELYNDLWLILSNHFVLVAAKDFKKLQISRLLRTVKKTFFAKAYNLADELCDVQGQELLVVSEYFVN